MNEKDYGRVAPLYWFKDRFGNPLDSDLLMLPGPNAFFFFTSSEYAERFLEHWLDVARSALPGATNPGMADELRSSKSWGMYSSDDTERLLAVCDELARIPGSPSLEGFLIGVPYDAFVVDPPLSPYSADRPIDLDAMKDRIRQKAEQGSPW